MRNIKFSQKTSNLVQNGCHIESANHNTLIVTIFMTIDAGFVILWNFEFFEKRTW